VPLVRRAAPTGKEVRTMRVKMLENREAALDGVTIIRLQAGDVVEMPQGLAERYLERGFAEPTEDALSPPVGQEHEEESEAGAEIDQPTEDALSLESLMQETRKVLDAQAAAAGVEEPEKLQNKQAVAEAILAARELAPAGA